MGLNLYQLIKHEFPEATIGPVNAASKTLELTVVSTHGVVWRGRLNLVAHDTNLADDVRELAATWKLETEFRARENARKEVFETLLKTTPLTNMKTSLDPALIQDIIDTTAASVAADSTAYDPLKAAMRKPPGWPTS